MTQHADSQQPTGTPGRADSSHHDDRPIERVPIHGAPVQGASRWPRLDQAAFALAIGLAALVSIIAAASLGGFEVAGAEALGLTGTRPASPDPGSPLEPAPIGARSIEPSTEKGASVGVDRVGYDTERSGLLATAALAQLDYDWESKLPNWRIDFTEGNDRVAGYTWSQEQRIEVFIRPNASSGDVARILAHELGHAVDVTYNTGDERQAWLDQRTADDDTEWWPSSGAADFETGAGDFAECFAVWLVGDDDYRSVVGPSPSTADLELIARLAR